MPERYVRVLRSDELAPRQMREVQVAGRLLVVGRLHDGSVVAFESLCPHEAARLVEGTLRGDQIDCPNHHYMWNLHTGQNTFPLPIYPEWKRAQVGKLELEIFTTIEEAGWISIRAPLS